MAQNPAVQAGEQVPARPLPGLAALQSNGQGRAVLLPPRQARPEHGQRHGQTVQDRRPIRRRPRALASPVAVPTVRSWQPRPEKVAVPGRLVCVSIVPSAGCSVPYPASHRKRAVSAPPAKKRDIMMGTEKPARPCGSKEMPLVRDNCRPPC